MAILGGRFRFPDNNRLGHLHVRMLLLRLLDCNSQSLVENSDRQSEQIYKRADDARPYLLLVHVVVPCDYDPLLDPRLRVASFHRLQHKQTFPSTRRSQEGRARRGFALSSTLVTCVVAEVTFSATRMGEPADSLPKLLT